MKGPKRLNVLTSRAERRVHFLSGISPENKTFSGELEFTPTLIHSLISESFLIQEGFFVVLFAAIAGFRLQHLTTVGTAVRHSLHFHTTQLQLLNISSSFVYLSNSRVRDWSSSL